MISKEKDRMTAANIWEETYSIRSYEVNAKGRLSIISLFNLLQDAASNHADNLGVSVHHLQSENLTWVLSRMHLTIDRYPRWRDRIRVHTWPSGANRLFALRDFNIFDGSGPAIGAAVSAWLVINTNTRRPVRVAPFIERLRPVKKSHVISDPLDKLPGINSFLYEKRIRVRYRDLDINQHVNNVSYIEWAVEAIPRDRMATAELTGLEISFLAEAFLDDEISTRCRPANSDQTIFLHSLWQEASGRELARVRTTWKPTG